MDENAGFWDDVPNEMLSELQDALELVLKK